MAPDTTAAAAPAEPAAHSLGERQKRRVMFVALLGLAVFGSAPVLGVLPGGVQDLTFHLYRIVGLADGLREGAFPVRIQYAQAAGQGYPVSIMYGDAALYAPALMVLAGVPVRAAYSACVLALNALTVFSSYVFLHRFSESRPGAYAATCAWTLGTYRLVDLYLRAAVGEYLALSAMPFIAYGLWCAFTQRGRASTSLPPCLWICAGMAGIVLSHPMSVALAFFALAGILVALALFGDRRARGWLDLLAACALTALVCLGFLVPFAEWSARGGMRLDRLDASRMAAVRGHVATVGQLLELFPTLTGISTAAAAGTKGEMPYAVGAGTLMLLGVSAGAVAAMPGRRTRALVPPALGVALLVALSCAAPLWYPDVPFMSTLELVQFPWRFVGGILILAAAMGALALRLISRHGCRRLAWALAAAVCALSLVEGGHSMATVMRELPEQPDVSAKSRDEDLVAGSVSGAEYLPLKVTSEKYHTVTPQLIKGTYDHAGYDMTHHADAGRVFDVHVKGTGFTVMELPLVWYPGYEVVGATGGTDGIKIEDGRDGYMVLTVPEGYKGTVHVKFVEPGRWRRATVVGAAAALACAAWAAASFAVPRVRARRARA